MCMSEKTLLQRDVKINCSFSHLSKNNLERIYYVGRSKCRWHWVLAFEALRGVCDVHMWGPTVPINLYCPLCLRCN